MKKHKPNIFDRINEYCMELPSITTRYAVRLELLGLNKHQGLDQWGARDALAYLRGLEGQLKASTIITKARRLYSYFKWEVLNGYRKENPINLKALPKDKNENTPQALTQNEVQKLLKQVPRCTWIGLRDRLAIGFMLTQGHRISTVININWEDIEKRDDGYILHTKVKGGKRMSRKLRPDIVGLLTSYANKTKECR
ncbi:MAG: tyrosine-type recombinase/integrase [Oligoflexia bacterium]|nr:tyrosine-type recombinase/integrase [Oligoflexia bacterium]